MAAALAFRLVHLVLYLLGENSQLFYLPVLGAYRFETSALEILSGIPQEAPFLYASPIYTYLILPFYLPGLGRLPLLVTQMLAGSLVPGLTAVLATRAGAGRTAATAAGLILAFYGPPVFLELTVLPVTLAALTTCLVLLVSTDPRPRVAAVLLAGAGCGILAGIRAPMAVVILPLLVRAFFDARATRAGRTATAAGAVAACLLVLLPLALHQQGCGAGFFPFPRSTGYNLALGHNSEANGYSPPAPSIGLVENSREDIGVVALRVAAQSGARDPASADRFWTRWALRWIASHPREELELVLVKLGGLAGFRPYDVYYDLSRLSRFNPALAASLPRFVPVAFACLGLIPFLVRGRLRMHLLPPMLASLFTSVVFLHSERFFLPALPAFLAAGAAGLSIAWRGRGRMRLAAAAGLVLMVPAVLRPAPRVPEGLYIQSLAARAYNMGDMELALTLYERAALECPAGSQARTDCHLSAASLLEREGDVERAEWHRLQASSNMPRSPVNSSR